MDIRVRLGKNFTTQLNKLQEKYGEDFMILQGLDDKKLSLTDFIDNFIDSDNVANASIDSNANVSHKDIVSLLSEMAKPHQKLLALNKIYYEIQKKYGFKTANEWLESNFTYALYLHDANTTTFFPYCFAYDLKDLAERGLFFIENYAAEPPKHLDSFVQILMEWVCFCSRRQSGAVGMPNLIPYLYYFWSRDVKNGYYTVSPERYARQQIQALIYRLNQPWVRTEQAAFTNTSIFDHPYFEAIFGGATFPDGSFMIDEEEEIIEFQKLFMEVMSDCRAHNMATFPVNTISLLFQNGKFVDEEFARWACKHNMKWNDSNFFTDSTVNSLSNCCRLKSSIEDIGYFNSIGGAALKVGSVKVSTVNLARIAYKHQYNEEEYLNELKEITLLNLKALDCVRHIIKRNVEKKLLPTFTHGLVDFEHLYNTLGINGIFETMKTFGYTSQDELGNVYYTDKAMAFGEKIFQVFDEVIKDFSVDKDYKINKEQVPAEQAAAKMLKADALLYPELVVRDLPLYGNQWIPLGIKTTLAERVRICSTFDKYCNGGSILHCNVDAPFDSFEKAWQSLNWMANSGVTYFAFTGKISACKHNHAFYGNICPLCGEPVDTYYSRIVGFFTPIKAYSKERKAEWELRQWENINET